MPAPILPIQPVAPIAVPLAAPTAGPRGSAFRDLLASSIAAVEQKQNEAQVSVGKFLAGESEDLHTVALAGQRAELSLELFMQVRNKVVAAYQEIMRMQL